MHLPQAYPNRLSERRKAFADKTDAQDALECIPQGFNCTDFRML